MSKGELSPAWRTLLEDVLTSQRMQDLKDFLAQRRKDGAEIYPPMPLIFNALNRVAPDEVKAVIIGQDPYHNVGQAMGLSFSVPANTKLPPSLANIYKEMEADVGASPDNGDLTYLADQGVLLLNALLTVERGTPLAHKGKGWEQFTDAVIDAVNAQSQPVVFILWGAYAWKKGKSIDESRHLVVKSVHPSPLSASRGFFGSKPFSQTNQFLIEHDRTPINWSNT